MYKDLNLSIEDKLLLLISRTKIDGESRKEILSIVKQDIDWDYFLKKSSIHKLKPLICVQFSKTCPELVPERVMDELKEYYNENARKNLLLTGELIKVLNQLDSENICAVHYKGPSLALVAYGDLTLREFIDVDMIIHRIDTKKARKIMDKLGYELVTLPNNFNEDLYFKTQTEHKFINPNSNTVFEFHNRVQGHFFYFPIDPAFLYEDLKHVKINNNPVTTFTNENLLLLLCIHCARHDWSCISWISDIHELIQKEEIEWTKVFENSEKLKVKRILSTTLLLSENLLKTDLPSEVSNYLKEDVEAGKICKNVIDKIFNCDHKSYNLLERLSLDFRERESMKLSLIDVLSSIFKPTYEDFRKFKLPANLYYFYYIIRPVLLFIRY